MITVTVQALQVVPGTVCRHYKSCSKSHGKEHLKRKALRHLGKTDIKGVNMTGWGRLFYEQTAAATGKVFEAEVIAGQLPFLLPN